MGRSDPWQDLGLGTYFDFPRSQKSRALALDPGPKAYAQDWRSGCPWGGELDGVDEHGTRPEDQKKIVTPSTTSRGV